MRVTVYTKPGCHLCDEVLHLVDKMTPRYGIELTEVNILDDMATYEQYKDIIPVVEVTEARVGRLVAPITEGEMSAYFDMARGVVASRSATGYGSVLPVRETAFDRLAKWIGKRWLRLVCVVMGIFVGIPWLAPVFASLGWWDLANPIYTAYALTCHQLPERAGSVFGYQVAFCYRNTALYGGIALFGVLYGLARDRRGGPLPFLRRQLPWWGLVLLLLPMSVDGVTHMLGLRDGLDWTMDASFGSFYIGSQPFSLNWWLRVSTGLLAAMGAVWFAFPRMQKAVDDAEQIRLIYAQSRAMRSQAQ